MMFDPSYAGQSVVYRTANLYLWLCGRIPIPGCSECGRPTFPQRLMWFKHASGLSWVKIARRLGVDPVTVRRWWQRGVRPNYRHLKALQDLADDLDLGHLFTG